MGYKLLAIESSCDDTAAAVFDDNHLVSHVVSTQLAHANKGGVIPELASRIHQVAIVRVVQAALSQAALPTVNPPLQAVACTMGPGLLGSLVVGVAFAKGLSMALNVPLVGVNHMDGHIYALFLEEKQPPFPFLCLTVSGGHTQITLVKAFFEHQIIGQTLDDAAGEAFDKAARFLGFDYPGGAKLDAVAQTGQVIPGLLPKPYVSDYNYSFSGLKTAILYHLQKVQAINPHYITENLPNLCATIQHTIVQALLDKLFLAAKDLRINHLAIVGGVSANSELRKQFEARCNLTGITAYMTRLAFATDNAAMIGITAHYLLKTGKNTTTMFSSAYANFDPTPY